MSILHRLIAWEQRVFLKEERWEFPIAQGYNSFSREISKRIRLVPKSVFYNPFDYTRSRGFYGYIDETSVKVRLKPEEITLVGLLSWSGVCYFSGKIIRNDKGDVLEGRYILTPVMRAASLIFSTAIIIFIIIGASILIYNSVTSYDHVMLVRSLTITAVGAVMLFLSYISGSYIRYFTKKERNAIYKLLQETTHAVNH